MHDVICSEARCPRHGQELGFFLPGQHMQQKTWLSRQLGTGCMLLRAGRAQEGAAECHGGRHPAVYTLWGPIWCRRWLLFCEGLDGKAFRQEKVKEACGPFGFLRPIYWDQGSRWLPRCGLVRNRYPGVDCWVMTSGTCRLCPAFQKDTPVAVPSQVQGLQQKAPRPSLLT